MNPRMIISRIFLTGIFVLNGVSGSAVAQQLCAPFQNGRVDESVMSTMLDAAEEGYLYRIQASTSEVGFCVESKLQRIEGLFGDFQGGMALLPEAGKTGQTVVLIRTGSLNTKGALVDNLIKSPRFFDVEHYPEILFVSTDFQWIAPNRAALRGNLTLHGVTKPVTFTVELSGSGDRKVGEAENIIVKAGTSIKRSDFGMDTLSTLVSDSVQLCMRVKAKKVHSSQAI